MATYIVRYIRIERRGDVFTTIILNASKLVLEERVMTWSQAMTTTIPEMGGITVANAARYVLDGGSVQYYRKYQVVSENEMVLISERITEGHGCYASGSQLTQQQVGSQVRRRTPSPVREDN